MGDSKNRKVPQKQKALNKSKRNSSSDQKENAPKREKTKTIQPDPDDGIAMSKQLLLKKSHARTLRQTSSKPERIVPNGKPMPSISVLNKMYEDSDDDDQTSKTTIQNPKRTPSTPEKRTPTGVIDKDPILPTTIDKITERLLGSIQNQNLPSPDELLEAAELLRDKSPPHTTLILPPKKRKVPEVPYIVGCKDRAQVIRKPNTNFCKGGDDYGVEGSAQDPEEETPAKRAKKSRIPKYTKSIFNAQSDAIAERLIKDDTGNLSDASSDSNKTIEYEPTPLQNPRPRSFSPLPSTSTDKKTFQKNDELFNESLKEIIISKDSTLKNANDDINDTLTGEIMEDDITHTMQSTPIKKENVLVKEESTLQIKDDSLRAKSTPNIIEDEIQIIEIPYDTIEIEDICDRNVEIRSSTSKAINTNDIEIIELVGSEVVKPKENNNLIDNILDDDDDCMIISSSETKNNHNNVKNLTDATIVIDDEYSNINMEFDSHNDEPIEIIDVDEIIAENNSILNKWKINQDKELNNINTVIDVPNTYRNESTPQTTVTPSMAVQTTSTPITARTALSAGVTTPSTTFPTPSTSTPNYDSNMTHRNSAINADNYQRQTSTADVSQRSARFHSILDEFFQSIRTTGSNVSSHLTKMVNRLQSPNYTPRHTSNQTRRPSSNRAPIPTSNPAPIPASNPAPIPTSSTVTTPSHPVSTVADTTSVFQNTINTLQNTDGRQRVLPRSNDSSSNNYETHETSMIQPPPSPIPLRSIGDCPICLDPLTTSNGIASTICGHVFCMKCIRASVKLNGKKCPTCRKILKGAGGGFHLLYL